MVTNKNEYASLYAASETNKRFFDVMAVRKKQSSETTVKRGMEISGGTKPEIVALYKKLAGLGAGKWVVGRKGSQSRITWKLRLDEIGQAAAGTRDVESIEPFIADDPDDGEALDEFGLPAGEGMEAHSYRLRKGLTIQVALPDDLTADEADRLAQFIKSLPIK